MASPPAASGSAPEPSVSPELPLPSTHFYSVEYPGYVKPTSVPLAIRHLGGQGSLDNAFRRAASKSGSLLELNLRPDNPFSHPIPGDLVATNSIVLKVVKRRRKKPEAGASTSGDAAGTVGEYTTEAVGVVHKTVRFRSAHTFRLRSRS